MDATREALSVLKPLDREAWLAALWAPARARLALAAALALDRELERVVASVSEPLLAEVRLAWWREQLDRIGGGTPPPAQPLLRALAAARHAGLGLGPLLRLEDALLPLLSEGPRDALGLSQARGEALAQALALLVPGAGASLGPAAARIALARLVRRELLGAPGRGSGAVGNWLAGPPAAIEVDAAPVPRLLAGLDALARQDLARAREGQPLATPAGPARQWLLARATLGFAPPAAG